MPTQLSQKFVRLALLFVSGFIAIYSTIAINAQDRPVIDVDFGIYVEDPQLRDAIRAELENNAESVFPGTRFAITSGRLDEEWIILSVASLNGPTCSSEVVGAGECGRLLLGSNTLADWRISLQGTDMFVELLNQTPDYFINSEVKTRLYPQNQHRSTSVSDFKFPWPGGASWEYRDGWHPPSLGLDIGTRNSDKRILAAADGVIESICRIGTTTSNVKINHNGTVLNYIHLEKNLAAWITELQVIKQGTLLGVLAAGTFNDDCGGTDGQTDPNSAHLHWALPTNVPFTVEGWTINYQNSVNRDYWRNANGDEIKPLDFITSSNAVTPIGEVGGIVRYSDGSAVSNAEVTIRGSGIENSTKTNSTGNYYLFFPAGSADIHASDGSNSSDIVMVTVLADRSIGANITLPLACTPRTGNACPPTDTPTPSRTPDTSPKVVLYAQVDYVGDLQHLPVGTHDVPNRLYYSMFVPNGMSATLYSADNRSRCFATSQHNLQDHEEWYRDIDRVQVHDHNACPATATPTPNNSGVVRLFAKANYEEEVLRLGQGSNPVEARNYFSIDMPDGWSVRLYTESGDNRCFEQDVPNLQDHEEWWRLTRRVDVMAYNGCGTASGKIRLYRVANYGDQFMELGVGTHTIAYNTQIFAMRVDSGMSAYFHAQDGRNRCWNENVSNMQDHESYWYDTVRIDVYGHDACPKPTATPTPSFTLTATPPPTPTDTPQPPTATPTKTRTSVPSPIETPTLRPTNTPTKTPTPTRTPTPTPRKLYLPLSLKSVPTITPTPTATSTPKPIDNTEWIVYEKWLPNSEGTEWGAKIELWIVKSDGSGLRPLVTGDYRNENPRWSPDGQRIVFDQIQVGVRKWRIMTIESDGSNSTTVAEFLSTSLYPSWLNDSEILFTSYRSSGWQLFKVAAGTGQTTPVDVGVPNIFSPSASPSTGHFAFHGNDGVYVSSSDTASVWPLMNGSAIVQGYPLNWHPDGQYVMVGDHPACHKIQIFDMTAEAIDGFPECNLSWSPTGDRIAYQSVRGPGGGIWIVNSDGSNRKELVPNSDNAFIRNPQWKPQR